MSTVDFTVTVGEELEAVNRIYVEVTTETLSYPMIFPVILLG